ncbi:Metal transporter Nramp3 [Micractinium conductrix]|uniref:Metal transporter Nramp3 n=1 Tax=Micractinium conductrix TaxID=554055 RepID=A0A2P6V3Z9_9CHLO|nr:Metal transporter Nramp3 [Micractinium conductrix]|eukprot:PSC68797.1 Metal transporter Nramp3 [Micractinium conductrix]
MAGEGHNDLDALLDDALEGFGSAETRRAPGGGAAGADAPVTSPPQQQVDKDTDAPGSSGRSVGGRPGLAFDPLPRRKGAAAGGAPGSITEVPASAGQLASDPGLDVLSEGLSKLLAELAQAEGESAPDDSSGAAAAAAGFRGSAAAAAPEEEQQQQQRDLHATLRALSDQAPSFAAGEPNTEDEMMRLLAKHLGALGSGAGDSTGAAGGGAAGAGGGGGGGGPPPEMSSLVDSIMHQLLSKEVLYQPMKDIGDKYPGWLVANKDALSGEDYGRYEKQYGYIQRICALYEANPSDFAQLIELLQAMQQCGQPPQEIVDELAPGMQFGSDGLPGFGAAGEDLPPGMADCAVQ